MTRGFMVIAGCVLVSAVRPITVLGIVFMMMGRTLWWARSRLE